jgi:succinoglycan biosynthesis transport protein ExoP
MDSLRPRTLIDLLHALKRRKALVSMPALVVIVASAIVIKRMPNIYESSTFILVESVGGGGSAEDSRADVSRRLATIQQQVTSRTRLESLIAKYGLYRDMVEQGVPSDIIIEQMQKDISVRVNSARPEVTDAFTISYRAHDPDTARKVAAELADQLIAENIEALKSNALGEAEVIRQQTIELSSKLRDMEQKAPWLLTLREDAPVAAPKVTGAAANSSITAMRLEQMAREALKDQQYKLQQQIADVERRLVAQRQIVERQKKTLALRDNPAYGVLVAKRAELQGQRHYYINQQGYTEKHPRVVAIDQQIAEINREIANLTKQDAGAIQQTPEERELIALESERNRLRIDLEVVGREISRRLSNPLPHATSVSASSVATSSLPREAGAGRLAQEYLGLKQSYKSMLSRLQDAELRQQAIENTKLEKFRVLDQANLPQVPISPNRRLLAVIAIALGLALGVIFGLAAELGHIASLRDASDVEYYTKLPLLAAIPKTLSHKERSIERRNAALRFVFGTTLAAAATFALAKLPLLVQLFSLLGRK